MQFCMRLALTHSSMKSEETACVNAISCIAACERADRACSTCVEGMSSEPFRSSLAAGHQGFLKLDNRSYLHHLHLRKAGGTSMRYFLNEWAKALAASSGDGHTVRLLHNEMGAFDLGQLCAPPGDDFAVFVTVLREPFERAISHFNYESNPGALNARQNQNESVWFRWMDAYNPARHETLRNRCS